MPRGVRRDVETDEVEIEPVDSNAIPIESTAKPIEVVGDMNAKLAKQIAIEGGVFKRIKASRRGWIKMTPEEAMKYQEQGILVGHDIKDGVGLLAKEE